MSLVINMELFSFYFIDSLDARRFKFRHAFRFWIADAGPWTSQSASAAFASSCGFNSVRLTRLNLIFHFEVSCGWFLVVDKTISAFFHLRK